MPKKKNDKEFIVEEFLVDPYQGAAAMASSLQKPGYKFLSMNRKGTKVKVTFQKVE